MSFCALPTCLQDLVCDIAWGLPYGYIKWDVDQCAVVQACVPENFMYALHHYKYRWGYINSPYRRGNAYYPRTYLKMSPCWNSVPLAFACMICKERVRSLKTYKGIFLRRVKMLDDHDLKDWNIVFKAFKLLRLSHFQRNANRSFVRQILLDVSEACPFPDKFFSPV